MNINNGFLQGSCKGYAFSSPEQLLVRPVESGAEAQDSAHDELTRRRDLACMQDARAYFAVRERDRNLRQDDEVYSAEEWLGVHLDVYA